MSAMNLRETTLLRPGEYPARVKAVTETTSRFDNKPQLQIDFELKDGRGMLHDLRVWCNAVYVSGAKASRLYVFTQALFGGTAPKTFDPVVDLVGRVALATVVIDRKGDGTEFNKLASLRAARPVAAPAPAPKPAPAPVAPPADDDDGQMSEEAWQRLMADAPADEEEDAA